VRITIMWERGLYSRISGNDNSDSGIDHGVSSQSRSSHHSWTRVALVVSVIANLLLFASIYRSPSQPEIVDSRSEHASLAWTHSMPFNSSSEFGLGSEDEATRSLAWERLDTSAGEISLDNEYARQHGLPSSTPFHWDKSRSIYLLNSYHLLHCMRKVRRWVTISQYNGKQLDSYIHIVHCMDQLVQDIICHADDTPLYTSPLHNATTGDGQQRMCRDWGALARWAEDQTSCFGYINETQGVDAVIQRFRYCPEGSPYGAAMREHFGYSHDWYVPRPEDVETMPVYWKDFADVKFPS